jgi:class 3 adenylate cyclase/tetratricopeptide (TPR) repeat protein/energy-coupling factor transporter ATP-binding protein EcfA2
LDIPSWLRGIGLEQYEQAFRQNDIDSETLPKLTAEDLKELGVTSLGHRKKLTEAIASLADSRGTGSEPVNEAPPKEAERRQLTVMFVDLVGSTALSQRLDPEDMRELIRVFQDAVAGEITRYEGHVAEFMGDGVLAYFGWPRSHEDEAERSVRAALATVSAVTRLAGDAEPLNCRIGIATGLVVVGAGAAQQSAAVGETPNLAARLQALAKAGEIVIAESTRRLLGTVFDLVALGPQDLKGIAAPVPAFVVTGEQSNESRFVARFGQKLSPIVGREQELALLQERWRQAQSSEGQLVLLVGEAGIGKSRIMQAMLDAVAHEDHVRIRYQCSPYYTSSALYPVIQQIALAGELGSSDSTGEKLDKLELLLARAGCDTGEDVPLVATLLGLSTGGRYSPLQLSPQQKRARTLDALIKQLVGLSRQQPVLWAIEDVHWADPTTQEFIELALGTVAENRVLAVLTARPTYEHQFGGHPIVTRLTLNRLGRKHVASIVDRITGGKALPLALLDEIARRTDGVPLFVEEMTKALLESGLMHEANGTWVLDAPLQGLTIPTSLHDSLMARLDRLQPVKQVAQTAAVIGREFDHALILAISGLPEPELEAALERLVEAELIFRRGKPPDATYLFKHALVRDAAYESLLKSRRQGLHGQIGRTLEVHFPEIARRQPELLARHFTEAGKPALAVPYWHRAGESAARTSANTEAVAHLRMAIELLDGLPEGEDRDRLELQLQTQLAGCLFATDGYSARATVATVMRAQQLGEKVEASALMFPVLYGQFVNALGLGEHPRALEVAERFLEAAGQQSDSGLRMVGHRLRGLSLFNMGRIVEGVGEFERSLSLYRSDQHAALAYHFGQDPRASALTVLGLSQWCLGSAHEARTTVEEAIAQARRSSHANSLAYALCWGGVSLGYLLGDCDMVERHARDLAGLLERHRMPMWEAYAHVAVGWHTARTRDGAAGIARIEKGLAELEASRTRYWRPFMLLMLSDSHLAQGATDNARAALEEALDAATRQHELWLQPELRKHRELISREPIR